jgi:cytidine deaminase
MRFDDLREAAFAVVAPRDLSPFASAGGVGAALLSDRGAVYTGVCIDTACSMGFCAEHAAAAAASLRLAHGTDHRRANRVPCTRSLEG